MESSDETVWSVILFGRIFCQQLSNLVICLPYNMFSQWWFGGFTSTDVNHLLFNMVSCKALAFVAFFAIAASVQRKCWHTLKIRCWKAKRTCAVFLVLRIIVAIGIITIGSSTQSSTSINALAILSTAKPNRRRFFCLLLLAKTYVHCLLYSMK